MAVDRCALRVSSHSTPLARSRIRGQGERMVDAAAGAWSRRWPVRRRRGQLGVADDDATMRSAVGGDVLSCGWGARSAGRTLNVVCDVDRA